ncbi:Alpha/Beta hydrolase protein [Tricharina praecox]|uniref:Alpha/Beta hydrolase protein n=1 Tax=Tricharina praecox TaxID=43433 RepID=UPI0022200FC8|nr:Alpha/Beta hydrolase protein [Tricharina praecox]KAI5858348.1 Alpha/Beta hydrolase protein [Tricharina praecox]
MSTVTDTLLRHYNALYSCPFHQTVLATTVLGLTTSYLLLRSTAPPPRSIPSPRIKPPTAATPYPPTILPGARLISTPHGTINVAEFGPPHGRKILLIHGISTPSIVFASLAQALASDGYRVMVFDLFGRGYSDAPTDVHYDERLFSTQILYALYASPLEWDRFSVVGYSLGGGIAVAFAAHFAQRIESLVLFAPAGLLKGNGLGYLTKLARGGWVPKAIETWMLGRRLATREAAHKKDAPNEDGMNYSNVMKWQAAEHKGFVKAFASSFRYGPIYDRQEEWRAVGKAGIAKMGVLIGEGDDVVPPALLGEMVTLLGGQERVRGEILVGAGHNLVRERWRECADFVGDVVGDPEGSDDGYDDDAMTASTSTFGDF